MTKVASPPTAAELLTEDPNQPTPRHRPNPPNHHQTQATLGGGIPKDKERIIVKCRAEADATPTPSYKDLMAMTTLVGAVYETLRLYTIIVGPAKKMTRDDQIPGVPKHTYVLPNKTVMGRRGHGVSFYGAFAARVASKSRIDGVEVLLAQVPDAVP